MSFITEIEATANVTEFASQTAGDKTRLLAQSETYLLAKNVKPYNDVTLVPAALKLASYEVIKGIIAGEIYSGQTQQVKRTKVKADTVESEKEFVEGSVALTATQQYINDLLAPYIKTGFQMVSRL